MTSTSILPENSNLQQPLHLKAVITSVRSRTDKSLSLTIQTPPLESKEKTPFMELQQEPLTIDITPQNNLNAPPLVIDKDIETKSQSERIRNVLYVWWKQTASDNIEFDEFYRMQTEKFIDSIKEKLHE
jgi:hypothetical protein